MTLDEFKTALEGLMRQCDESLANEAIRTAQSGLTNWPGVAYEVTALFPRNLRERPDTGMRVRLALSASVEHVRLNYVESPIVLASGDANA